jgi:RimJ/RimL family protein N-acetyltransferase
MKSKHIPIAFEEFESIEHPFGWKAEYFNGAVHFTPREHLVRTLLAVTPRSIGSFDRIVPVEPSFKEQLIAAFIEAFVDSVEFCNWSVDAIHTHAAKNINNYFQGVRGQPHPVSRMVIDRNNERSIVGLALFVEKKDEVIELDLLLVKPSHQRMGIATQMVASAIDRLNEDGVKELRSGYHICNDRSRAWHHSLGFRDIPDYFYCKLKAAWYRHEIRRCEKSGSIERLEEFRSEVERWQQLSKDLEPWKEDF